jgi:hypothetical protein
MAKVILGSTIAAASGSIGGTVHSRNRYGTYIRNRAIPVNPNTIYQQEIRAILAARSQEWRGLNVLGMSQVLQPNAAYVRLNMLTSLAGDSIISVPPITDAPDALTSLSIDADILGPKCELTFAATPLDTDDRLCVYAAVLNSIGVTYVENLYKLVVISDKAQATAFDVIADVQERFGTLIEGQAIHIRCCVLDSLTGLVSPCTTDSSIVVDTTP